MNMMKHIQTWLLITLLALSANGVVNAKLASGHQNLSGGAHQSQTVLNALLHQRLEEVSTTNVSGSPLATKGGLLRNANFAQNNLISPTKAFSDDGIKIFSGLAGKPIRTVGDLTDALKGGLLTPRQVPVDFVDINGARLILNTRTSTALQNAGFTRSQFFGRNRTGQTAFGNTTFDDLARQQLRNNGLPPTGSPTLP